MTLSVCMALLFACWVLGYGFGFQLRQIADAVSAA